MVGIYVYRSLRDSCLSPLKTLGTTRNSSSRVNGRSRRIRFTAPKREARRVISRLLMMENKDEKPRRKVAAGLRKLRVRRVKCSEKEIPDGTSDRYHGVVCSLNDCPNRGRYQGQGSYCIQYRADCFTKIVTGFFINEIGTKWRTELDHNRTAGLTRQVLYHPLGHHPQSPL